MGNTCCKSGEDDQYMMAKKKAKNEKNKKTPAVTNLYCKSYRMIKNCIEKSSKSKKGKS